MPRVGDFSSVVLCLTTFVSIQAQAQKPDQTDQAFDEPVLKVAQRVDVELTTEDTDIATRLTRILEATEGSKNHRYGWMKASFFSVAAWPTPGTDGQAASATPRTWWRW